MARFRPQGLFVDGWRDDFLEAIAYVLFSEELDKSVEDSSAVWEEDGGSGAVDGSGEELLLGSNVSVVRRWWFWRGEGRTLPELESLRLDGGRPSRQRPS